MTQHILILHARTDKLLYDFQLDYKSASIGHLKYLISKKTPKLYPERQALRMTPKGRPLPDDRVLVDLDWEDREKRVLYLRDLGPQIGWNTVFMCEYAGPLVIFPIFYLRPWFIYGDDAAGAPYETAATMGLICWSFHYAKRLYETAFVHRFSHGTMPIRNLFKNCSYYWGFAAFVAYFVCHPLFTPPKFGTVQLYTGLGLFLLGEIGNYSIHIALRDLRPPGSKERKIPMPTSNPFTSLFNLVSCPNYTYEIQSWFGFCVMTQCLPAVIFCAVGAGQMTVWALGKQRAYLKEFGSNYPKRRKAIFPFLI